MNMLEKIFDRGAKFPVRHMKFQFASIQHSLFQNNPWGEYWLATMSAMFPAGERFFVHSVRNLQHRAQSQALKTDIAAFIGQEAMHAKEHEALNAWILGQNMDTRFISANVEWLMAALKRYCSASQQLAITAAAEHFTAILAHQIMRREDLQQRLSSNETLKNIWLWHAIEESEHKNVAFDLYQDAQGSNVMRVLVMPPTTLYMIGLMVYGTVKIALQHRQNWNLRQCAEFYQLMFDEKGFIRTLKNDYLDYYHTDFHPLQHDSSTWESLTKIKLGLN